MAGPLDEASPTGNDAATIKVIDTRGRVRWKYSNTSLMYDLSVAGSSKYGSKVRTALDKSGNVFLDYNPGRYNGVIVLRPVAGGFANFRTLPTPGDFNGRFYFAELSDADSDGTYEIISSSNDCTPSCAEGTTTSTVWRWNGHDYVTG